MIFDNHVHVGWFTDGYHSPKDVWYSELAAGVDGMAVSSTSTCAELYKVVVREMRELIRLGDNRIHPILWLTPTMLKKRYALPYMLHNKVNWKGVKMHWEAHPEWTHNPKLVEKALDVARRLGCPVLLHTGEDKYCHAGFYIGLIKKYADLTFVLAHGRPVDEAIEVLKQCPNSFVDTAFMPMSDLSKIIAKGLSNRVIFGTDAPINRIFYKDLETIDFIRDTICLIQSECPEEANSILSRSVYK